MKPTKDEIKQYTSQALQRCLDSFPRLDDKEWGKKASDQWTAKDYLAHLVIAHEEEANRLIQQALAGESANIPASKSKATSGAPCQKGTSVASEPSPLPLSRRFRAIARDSRVANSRSWSRTRPISSRRRSLARGARPRAVDHQAAH